MYVYTPFSLQLTEMSHADSLGGVRLSAAITPGHTHTFTNSPVRLVPVKWLSLTDMVLRGAYFKPRPLWNRLAEMDLDQQLFSIHGWRTILLQACRPRGLVAAHSVRVQNGTLHGRWHRAPADILQPHRGGWGISLSSSFREHRAGRRVYLSS